MIYDFCVIGGGIVGLATAMKVLERQPGASLVLLEKEATVGLHQTGHNSGVIHAGIYYAPGSLKADFCRRGAKATKEFCTAYGIPFETCGKLIVATNAVELGRLEQLVERAKLNGIEADRIDAAEIRRLEPHIDGIGGLLVHETGIVDYKRVCQSMRTAIMAAGGSIELMHEATSITESGDTVSVVAAEREWRCRKLIACAGLQSDRLARIAGIRTDHRIVPFRGEYFRLPPSKNAIIKHLIYPVPDPDLPFLGVHLTRMIDGSVTVGPNAVLGFAREGYPKFSLSLSDIADFMSFAGFWKTSWQNRASGLREFRNSFFKSGYLAECRKYCPSLELADLQPMEAGIRAQAVMRNGALVHDFLFLETDRMLHVCNAPSPAATSALPIGEMIVDKVLGTKVAA